MSQAKHTGPTRQERSRRTHRLRERGLTWEQIADVWETDYPEISPRVAFRWAHNLTHQDVAERWNVLDPGEPTMTKSRIYEFEVWPQKGRRPGTHTLRILARIYQTTARRLLSEDEYCRYEYTVRAEIDVINHRNLDENQYQASDRQVNSPDQSSGRKRGGDGVSVEPVKRRDFGRATLGVTLALPFVGSADYQPVDVTKLSPDDAVADLYALDDRYGGAAISGIAQRRLVSLKHQLNKASLGPSAETHVQSVIGTLATCAAWLTYDAGDAAKARTLDAEALYAGHVTNNRDLQIEVLASMSMQANAVGRPKEALNLAESGATVARTADARVRSLLAMRAASAAAAMADERHFAKARSDSWRLLEQSRNDDRPAWFQFFDERELIGLEACGLIRLGRYRDAATLLQELVAEQNIFLRNRLYYSVIHAEALIGSGEPDGVAAALSGALPMITEVASTRILRRLKTIRTRLQPFVVANQNIAECVDVLDTLVD
jgi:hypothetical protein